MPAATTAHPEEDEEPDENEKPFGSGHWRPGPGWNRSRTLTAFLAAAGVGVIVATTGSVARPAAAGSKTDITGSKQVQVVMSGDLPYEEVGPGSCQDVNGNPYTYNFFSFDADSPNPGDCALNLKCGCAQGVTGVTLRGWNYSQDRGRASCQCLFDPIPTSAVNDLSAACSFSGSYFQYSGTGEIKTGDNKPDFSCYR